MKRYLAHHGVKGQKWGVRNGPPYPLDTVSNGNAIRLKNYNGPAYFISEKELDKSVLTPRIPKNYLTDSGYEDNFTPRVSFAPSVDKCLAGLSKNVEDKEFYVYSPKNISECKVYKPNEKAVPDSKITDELWITNPVELELVKRIKVTGNRGKNGKTYSYGDKQAVLFDDWTYEDVSYLMHHGIKGQKWGVRRYQNPDGSLTPSGKQRALEYRNFKRNKKYTDDVNDIVKTLSKKEKDFLGAPDKGDWINKKHERETLINKANTFVSKEGNTPISFVELWTNGGTTAQVALATRNDHKYRGKGYASKNVEEAIKWCDRYGNKSIKEIEWIADRNNIASVNLGKKYGFVEDDPNKHGHDWKDDWSKEYAIMYRKVKSG